MLKILACINKITINRLTGIPIFLFIMYCMFFFSVCIGGAFQPFFNLMSQALFIDLPHWMLTEVAAPNWLQCIVVHGIGRGLNVTITFIPVLMCMFWFLSFLENSGYVARAAFVMNNFMNYLGLPGKSFIPMIIGFGCNVPAVLSTKILHKRQERILTIMMVPFISCGAKLAIYAIFVTAFFPSAGQNIVFLLYVTGIVVAIFTGLMLKSSLFKEAGCNITPEFPLFKFPNLLVVYNSTIVHLKNFLFKAGSIIIPLCVVVGALEHVKVKASSDTILALVGKTVTPIFAPMGIQQDNWPAVVGLMTGVISKEVIIGTLTTLYEQEQYNHNSQLVESTAIKKDVATKNDIIKQDSATIRNKMILSLHEAIYGIPDNLVNLKNSFLHPFTKPSVNKAIDRKILGTMCLKFNSAVAAFSYLLFILLYCPCVSVVVMIMRELGCRWALFAVAWTTGLAYIIAVVFYQIFTVSSILEAILWIAGAVIIFIGLSYLVKTVICKQMRVESAKFIPTKIS